MCVKDENRVDGWLSSRELSNEYRTVGKYFGKMIRACLWNFVVLIQMKEYVELLAHYSEKEKKSA